MPDAPCAPGAGPLAGKQVLVTRRRDQAGGMAERIRALGGEVFAFEAVAIADPVDWEPVDEILERLGQFDWVVLTSANGVEKFMERLLGTLQADARALAGAQLAAVGPGTAAALRGYGLLADLVPSAHNGEALVEALRAQMAPGTRVLVVRPEQAAVDVAGALADAGAAVVDCIVYRTVPGGGDPLALRAALAGGQIHYAAFASGSAIQHTLAAVGGPGALATVTVAVIGPQTERAARAAGLEVHLVAPQATIDALVQVMADHAAAQAEGGTHQ